MKWTLRETVEALRRIRAIAEDGSHCAPLAFRDDFHSIRLDAQQLLNDTEDDGADDDSCRNEGERQG